jgi:predicted regulator of Ras-like GTPase activity (Roadblock/LC7/MglB family)
MSSPVASDLVGALEGLKASSLGVRSVFLASSQGRFLGSTQLTGSEKVQMAAVSAASIAIANKSVSDLHIGHLAQVHIVADDGSILMLNVGARAILSVLLDGSVKIESILPEVRRAADRLQRLV